MFDDDKVTRNVSPAVVLKQNAYILFYKKNKPNSRTTSASAPLNKSSETGAPVPVISTTNNKKKNKRKGNTASTVVTEPSEHTASLSASSEVPLNSSGDVAKSPRVNARPKCRAYYRTKEDDSIEDLVIKMQLADLVI